MLRLKVTADAIKAVAAHQELDPAHRPPSAMPLAVVVDDRTDVSLLYACFIRCNG